MVTQLGCVIVKSPDAAFRSPDAIAREWRGLGYTRPPDLDRARREHECFVALLRAAGATVLHLPSDERTTLDSIYVHDPALITAAGAVLFQTGKPERRGEGPALGDALRSWDIPILGTIGGIATAEGGDMVWLDGRTLLAGRGFRSNGPGIAALADLLGPLGVRVIPVQLPYGKGPGDVLHLMSLLSLLDDDLAVVYRPMLPVALYELLLERGMTLVDVPDEEFAALGCNVLALSPRRVVMTAGSPVTRSRLQAAGCEVQEFDGSEICLPGSGGPTCLTRPVLRA